jgi:3-methylfumaryl-CoA hydratase
VTAGLPQDADFSDWIGRHTERRDRITPRMVREFEATLAPHLAPGLPAPAGIFWCLAPEAFPAAELGPDGHPRTGLVLPALPFPRRMWAGGELLFHGDVRTGDEVDRHSTIEAVTFKTGSTGRLGFVTVRHRYSVAGHLVLNERQDIVYREPPSRAAATVPVPSGVAGPGPEMLRRWSVETDPTLLFRYSALTFNGHRIHYDHPYATAVEGYEGLVVHGPLQATLLLTIAAAELGRLPRRFAYRGLTALTCGMPLALELARDGAGALSARAVTQGGVVTMAAQVDAV